MAGGEQFKKANLIYVFLNAVIWAPVFETLVGQVLPVGISRKFTARRAVWVIAGGMTFALGHVLGGGELLQSAVTFFYGCFFSAIYVAWLPTGIAKAAFGVAVVQAGRRNAACHHRLFGWRLLGRVHGTP